MRCRVRNLDSASSVVLRAEGVVDKLNKLLARGWREILVLGSWCSLCSNASIGRISETVKKWEAQNK